MPVRQGPEGDRRNVMEGESYRPVNGAWIHPRAQVSDGATIEPGAVVGEGVAVGRGCWIGSGAVLYGPTVLGEGNRVHPTAVLGGAPQDVGYKGEATRLVIGERNVFREAVTVSRGSAKGTGETRIGNDCYFMAGSHIGHDCLVEDHVVLANDVLIAGHCHIGSRANIAGGVAIVQFTTVGRFAFVGGLAGSTMDLEPFILHDEMPCRPKGINVVGLRRGQVPHEVINKLKEAYRVLFTDSCKGREDLDAAEAEIERRGAGCPEVAELLQFMRRMREGRFGRQAQSRPQVKFIPEGESPPRG
jgi:UDP-N-acetylglucosamine acyltransferase